MQPSGERGCQEKEKGHEGGSGVDRHSSCRERPLHKVKQDSPDTRVGSEQKGEKPPWWLGVVAGRGHARKSGLFST